MVIYTVIILLPQGFYILWPGFFFRSIRFLHANLARLLILIQQRSRLQTLVSSYHSNTSAQRTPSVDSWANSQYFPGLLERGHLSLKSIRGARNENMENIENLTLSPLYNAHFDFLFSSVDENLNSPYSPYSPYSHPHLI